MITPTETVLGGLVISVISGVVGKYLGNNNKVSTSNCLDHRDSCTKVMTVKFDNLNKKVDSIDNKLDKIISNKLLGL